MDWNDTNELADNFNRETVRALLDAASDPPARLAQMDPEQDPAEHFAGCLSHGSGPVWGVLLPEHDESVGGWEDRPEHGVIACWTGNGPRSEANARLYAAAPLLARALLNAWDQADELAEDAHNLRAKLAEATAS